LLTTSKFFSYVEANQEGASYPAISNSKVKQFRIPLPHASEQERIVSILGRFDSLVNDISFGLPAEIEARKKQYEYYRNRLLTFEPLKN
jgi:type I restriction enzyme S subunit